MGGFPQFTSHTSLGEPIFHPSGKNGLICMEFFTSLAICIGLKSLNICPTEQSEPYERVCRTHLKFAIAQFWRRSSTAHSAIVVVVTGHNQHTQWRETKQQQKTV